MADFRHPDKRPHPNSKNLIDLIPLLEGSMTRQERENLRNALVRIEGVQDVKIRSRSQSITGTLTTITSTSPGTADYAIQDLTTSSPYGFVSSNEAQTVLQVIANLQARVNELEQVLIDHGILNG